METLTSHDYAELDKVLADLDINSANADSAPIQANIPARARDTVASNSHVDQRAVFYQGLQDADARELQVTAERIRKRHRASIIDTGKDLQKIKAGMDGIFTQWLKVEFDMSARTAWNYISTAEAFGSTPEVVDALPPVVVYKLAAQSTPQSVRDAVVQEIIAGTIPKKGDLDYRIAEAKEVSRKEQQKQKEEQLVVKEAAADAKAWGDKEKKLKEINVSDEEIARQRKEWDASRSQREQERLAGKRHQKDEPQPKRVVEDSEDTQNRARQAAEFIKQQLGSKLENLRNILGEDVDALVFARELAQGLLR